MDKTFAGLLRHSRLASYDRTLPQVYTTPVKSKKIGNWGLKRSLPTVVRTRYVTVGDLDTAEHQTPWQSGESQVLFIKRWKENFPNSKAPLPRKETIQKNVAAMTPREFKQFLKQASQQSPQFQQLLQKKELVPEQVYEYLNCHFNKDIIMNDQYQQHQQHDSNGIVGPTYSDYQDPNGYNVVSGRILNNDTDGYAVGIGGVVAKLSRRNASQVRGASDRKVRQFIVLDAKMNEQGKPEVHVKEKTASPSIASLLSSNYYNTNHPQHLYNNNISNNNEPGLDDMFAGRRSTRFDALQQQTPNEPDNVVPHPQHNVLMKRISNLLDNQKK
ncbi:unnamed protein product [Cunninghamella blakesleeana]